MSELHQPVEPAVLADAISKLDTLRMTKTPGASGATSPAASVSASGASSPNVTGLPGVDKVTPLAPDGKTISAPGTPHFGAQTEM
jgi:6-phosphofructo-2-kinase/fructose-2,6-biphosphatase 2